LDPRLISRRPAITARKLAPLRTIHRASPNAATSKPATARPISRAALSMEEFKAMATGQHAGQRRQQQQGYLAGKDWPAKTGRQRLAGKEETAITVPKGPSHRSKKGYFFQSFKRRAASVISRVEPAKEKRMK
jgi:hypothetical protein